VSTKEIIAELPKLNRHELEQVSSKLHELLGASQTIPLKGKGIKQFAGAVKGLPTDMARNHDHYLHGRQKK
jgi:hypothetical protein